MTTQRADAPDQTRPWGPQPVPDSAPAAFAINDVELVADVIRAAATRGYVLIGPAQQVFAWVDEKKKYGRVERVPRYEQDAVHQLLTSRHLRIGGTHLVSYGGREGPANSVLVPRSSRAMVTRWGNYRPLR
jgi:hypothetical protein